MMSKIGFLLLMVGLTMLALVPARADTDSHTAYDFSFSTLIGNEPMPLQQFKGKVLLVVNTASQCGFTGQYEGLEKLYQKYSDKGLVIIGVPSNDFGEQEPGSNDEISHFCKLNYGVSFPMTSKEDVIGDNAHPFYQWARAHFGYLGKPKWNFHKYLVDRSGNLVDYYYSTTEPDDESLVSDIEKQLDQEPSQPATEF